MHLNMQQKCARVTVKGSIVSEFLGRITHTPAEQEVRVIPNSTPPLLAAKLAGYGPVNDTLCF